MFQLTNALNPRSQLLKTKVSNMERHDIEFDIMYSYFLEKMFGIITGRIDRFITFIIIISGFSIFVTVAGFKWYGGLIATLSVVQIVYQFSRASGIAEEQAKKYLSLNVDISEMDDTELKNRFKELQKTDSNPWGILKNTAFKRASIALGRHDTTDRLTLTECFVSILSGDLPKEKKCQTTKKN